MFEKDESAVKSVDGFYEHKETGAVVQLINEAEYGTPLTNAFVKAGYVFVGTVDPREAKAKAEAEKAKVSDQSNQKNQTKKEG